MALTEGRTKERRSGTRAEKGRYGYKQNVNGALTDGWTAGAPLFHGLDGFQWSCSCLGRSCVDVDIRAGCRYVAAFRRPYRWL